MLRHVDHKHIVKLFTQFQSPDSAETWSIYEHTGESLAERLQRGPLSVPEARKVASELASALGYLHQKGVVHRALCPENVVFDECHSAKLRGFANAVPQSRSELLAPLAQSNLPAAFVAPELSSGKKHCGKQVCTLFALVLVSLGPWTVKKV